MRQAELVKDRWSGLIRYFGLLPVKLSDDKPAQMVNPIQLALNLIAVRNPSGAG